MCNDCHITDWLLNFNFELSPNSNKCNNPWWLKEYDTDRNNLLSNLFAVGNSRILGGKFWLTSLWPFFHWICLLNEASFIKHGHGLDCQEGVDFKMCQEEWVWKIFSEGCQDFTCHFCHIIQWKWIFLSRGGVSKAWLSSSREGFTPIPPPWTPSYSKWIWLFNYLN